MEEKKQYLLAGSKLKLLIQKYNDVLYESMRIAVAEDLINLIIVNKEDDNFDLRELIANKSEFKEFVVREFFRNNYRPVTSHLSSMKEKKIRLKK